MSYIIKYEYNSWTEGCGCCSDSSSELTIYETSREDGAYMSSFSMDLIGNEQELREWIKDWYPEYSDFIVHEDCRWF